MSDPIPAGADPIWQPQPGRYVWWTFSYRWVHPDPYNESGWFSEPVLMDVPVETEP